MVKMGLIVFDEVVNVLFDGETDFIGELVTIKSDIFGNDMIHFLK